MRMLVPCLVPYRSGAGRSLEGAWKVQGMALHQQGHDGRGQGIEEVSIWWREWGVVGARVGRARSGKGGVEDGAI